jgi:hypothetical protein
MRVIVVGGKINHEGVRDGVLTAVAVVVDVGRIATDGVTVAVGVIDGGRDAVGVGVGGIGGCSIEKTILQPATPIRIPATKAVLSLFLSVVKTLKTAPNAVVTALVITAKISLFILTSPRA